MRNRTLLGVLPFCGLIAVSNAWVNGPYASVYGGTAFVEDANNKADSFAGISGVDVESEFDPGFVVGGTAGYAFGIAGWPIRFEADVGYRQSDVDKLRFDGVSTSDVGGDVNALSGLVNVWLDVPTGTAFTPYVGGGIGVARVSLSDVKALGEDLVDDEDTVLDHRKRMARPVASGFAFCLISLR